MDQQYYNETMVIFQVPEQFYDQARLMMTDEELKYIHEAKRDNHTLAEVNKYIADNKLSSDPQEFLKTMYAKCIVDKVELEDGTIGYKVNNFYRRYPFFAQFEHEKYTMIPRTIKTAMNLWDFSVYFPYKKEVVEQRMRGDYSFNIEQSDYLTLEEAIESIENSDGFINVVPCNCKAMYDYQKKPVNVCMHMGDHAKGINTASDRGLGEVIGKEEAIKRLKSFNKAGLMQCGEPAGFCNCDELSCYPHHIAELMGSRFNYPRSHYHIDHHEDECISCGICVNLCNFHAFEKDANGKVHYNADKCWECTMCASNCPKKAIHLIKKED